MHYRLAVSFFSLRRVLFVFPVPILPGDKTTFGRLLQNTHTGWRASEAFVLALLSHPQPLETSLEYLIF